MFKHLLISLMTVLFAAGCTTQAASLNSHDQLEVASNSGPQNCKSSYNTNGWQMEHANGYVAHMDDRRAEGRLKVKLDYVHSNGFVCTVASQNITDLGSVHIQNGKALNVNFAEYFPHCSFGRVYLPADEAAGKYGEIAAAGARCSGYH